MEPAGKTSVDDRRTILQGQVRQYVAQGFRVVHQGETTAQLVRQRKFSLLWAVLLVFTVVGLPLYLLWYLTRQKEIGVYVEVDEFGKVMSGGKTPGFQVSVEALPTAQ